MDDTSQLIPIGNKFSFMLLVSKSFRITSLHIFFGHHFALLTCPILLISSTYQTGIVPNIQSNIDQVGKIIYSIS